jgi:hypothetical protein
MLGSMRVSEPVPIDESAQRSDPSPIVASATTPDWSTTTIGRIERVPLRDVWKHEAHNLTTWLEENIDVLNEVLDFN